MLKALALALLIPFGHAAAQNAPAVDWTIPNTEFTPVAWSDLQGWELDNHAAAFETFLASCRVFAARSGKPIPEAKPLEAPLAAICQSALAARPADSIQARAFFEAQFQAVRIRRIGEAAGFLTGYYEPIVAGSRVQTEEFKTPVYRRPHDLVSSLRRRGPGFPNRGAALRRVGKKQYVPYYERGEIEDGVLAGKGLELCWVKDPIDLFFIQIQGSARVRLQDGGTIRLNYSAHNGQPYSPVGADLVQRGIVPREEMSMDRIRQWMLANPEEGKALRRINRSYVFFRIANLAEDQEAVGAQGIPLTSGRSLAVDRHRHVYGTPFWLDAELPLGGIDSKDRFRRLMIGQDTGSAILGPARGDIYFGAGDDAGRIAGRIRHPAEFVMLVPKALKPITVTPDIPMPRPRPATQ